MATNTIEREDLGLYRSRRAEDILVEKRMRTVMDRVYADAGLHILRTNENNAEMQKRGADLLLRLPGCAELLWVDEKSASRYWDRDLNTFAFELGARSNVNGKGWFLPDDDYNVTTHYMLIWPRAKDAGLNELISLECLLVSKSDLWRYLKANGHAIEQLLSAADASNRVRLTDELTIVRTPREKLPEEPVNLLFSRDLLRRLALFSRRISYSGGTSC